jgi:hypothetical protein
MKPSKLYEALLALIGERVPLHIWGPCGTLRSRGKLESIAAFATTHTSQDKSHIPSRRWMHESISGAQHG